MNALRSPLTLAILVAVFAQLMVTGCQPKRRSRSAESGATAAGSREELEQAVDLMGQLGEIPLEKAETDLAYLLNRWIRGAAESPGWKRDPLADRLPKIIRDAYDLSRLERGAFDLQDSRVLLEAQWCRDISDWAAKQPTPKPMAAWLAGRQPALSRDEAEQLRIGERIFDWTIRNWIRSRPMWPKRPEPPRVDRRMPICPPTFVDFLDLDTSGKHGRHCWLAMATPGSGDGCSQP
jgi:hypothetical protein